MSFQFPLEYQTPPLLFQHSIEKMNEKMEIFFLFMRENSEQRLLYTFCIFFGFALVLLCHSYNEHIYILFFGFQENASQCYYNLADFFHSFFLFFYGLIFSGENVPIFHQLVFSVGTTIFWYRDKGFSATHKIDNIYIFIFIRC